MGLFGKKVSPEEEAAREANKEILDKFNVTAAWGVKSAPTATQFIYDENMKAFCIADGPVEDDNEWKKKNPWVINFSEVEDVWLEVDEWWNDNPNKYDVFHDYHVLPIDKFDEVYWHYDLYMNIKTTHPFCDKIRYKMNFNTNVLMIPGIHLIARRGLELSGDYRGKDIKEKREELEKYAESLKENLTTEKIVQIVAKTRPDSILDRIKHDLTSEWYVSRVENVAKHVKRAERISKLILNK